MTGGATTVPSLRWASSVLGLAGEDGEGFSGEAHDAPLGEDVGSDGLVDGDGGGVPGEDVPLEAGAALFYGDASQVSEEGFTDSRPRREGVT